jgi:2-oxoisovalerate dehydrogenase E2 component (dihydrolipoyl transacylase)
VAEFDKICEVQSDKASVEITSRFAGKVSKLYHSVHDIAKVGEPLVDIETDGADDGVTISDQPSTPVSTPPPASTTGTSTSPRTTDKTFTKSVGNTTPSELTLATPAVRRLAKEQNVDISQVAGSGANGRVMKEDIMNYVSGKQSKSGGKETTGKNGLLDG